MAHDWHKSSRLAWQQVWPTGKNIFFLNYFILKYQFNVLLLGNYLQYLHDDTTDEKKVVLRSAGVIFIHILGDWGDLTSVRSEQRWSWATGCAGLVSIMALGHCYGESWRGAEERPAAWEAATFCFFADADGEVGAEGSAGNSQKLLRGRVDLDMHKTHTHTTRG